MKPMLFCFIFSCFLFEKDKTTDSIITDTIYTVNNSFDKATAMAISDGKILAIGTNDEITNKFKSDNTIDAKGKFMYPGLIALSFYSYGLSLQEVDLRGTKSMDEVISRIQTFQKRRILSLLLEMVGIKTIGKLKNFLLKQF
jgi:predicted amidohydrolase YtcJ